MADAEFNLQDLNERITILFERCKEELNGKDHPNVSVLLYYVNQATDNLLYKVKYEIEQFITGKLKEDVSTEAKSLMSNYKKAECLIKLQTLTSELTCHIVEDYKKKVEGDRK